MRSFETSRGFIGYGHEKYASNPVEMGKLVEESTQIGDYDDSFQNPGSSYLWIGMEHHLNREEVAQFIGIMQYWLEHKRLPINFTG